jgi:hypothetical protein
LRTDELRAELTDDPMKLGYAVKLAADDDQGAADLLNQQRLEFSKTVPSVPLQKVLKWGALTGALASIRAAADDPASPVRAAALASLTLLSGAVSQAIDLSDSDILAMVDAFVAAGVVTAAQRQSLLALRTAAPASRAEMLWGDGAVVAGADVSAAYRGSA